MAGHIQRFERAQHAARGHDGDVDGAGQAQGSDQRMVGEGPADVADVAAQKGLAPRKPQVPQSVGAMGFWPASG